MRRPSGSGAVVGGLLVFFGLIGLAINFAAGLMLTGIGILLATAAPGETVLSCPGCGARGVTLGEIARMLNTASAAAVWKPKPEVIASSVSAVLAAVGALIWSLVFRA